jgi:lysophospholipase L1-like esterase
MTRRRPRVGASNRLLDLAMLLLLALAVGSSALAVAKTESPASATSRAPLVTPSEAPPAVTSLWFGDSIVEGCCRSAKSVPTMAQVAAQRLGWAQPQIVAAGGTGYTTARANADVRSGTYADRIAPAVEGAYYDVVVVVGGNNDDTPSFDPTQFRSAVRSVLEQVRTSLPEAELVVLGPYSPDATGYRPQRAIEAEEAARVGATFIDQVGQGWMRGRPGLLHADGFHPNDDGHAHLGAQMAAALREALPPDMTAPRPTPATALRAPRRAPTIDGQGASALVHGVAASQSLAPTTAGQHRKQSTWN